MQTKQKKLPSIKTRLLLVNLGIIFVAFMGVIIAFNLLMDNSITSTATSQISDIVNRRMKLPSEPPATSSTIHPNTSPSEPLAETTPIPNLDNASTGPFNTRPVAIIINNKYEIQTPATAPAKDIEDAQSIATSLKSGTVQLSGLKNYRLETSDSTFYIETVKESNTSFLLFYTNITGIVNFAASVTFILFLIMLAVIAVTSFSIWFVTGRMTKPLFQLASFARRIGKGDFTAYTQTFNDRELMILAANLNNSALQLRENDQERQIFFQNASHELRTPLMTIRSYAEGIKYDVMPPKEASETILTETNRMTEMVEDLLTVSRLEHLEKQQEFNAFDLRELITDVTAEQEPLLQERNLVFVYDFDKTPVRMNVNYKAMRRAISNLISNSLRYARHEITLAAHANKDEITLTVSNDGPAISENDIPHIFDRFYKGSGGVHGIGLSIVKAVIEQHKGRIQVESSETKTSFLIHFPLK